MPSTIRHSLAALACVSALAIPRLAAAAVEFTPVVGLVHPLKSEYIDLDLPLVFNLEPSSAYGARLAWWATPRVGLEGSLVGSAATLRLIGGSALETSGTLFEGDGRLRLRLNSPGASHHFDAIGGVGISDTQFDLSDFLARSGLKRKARTTWVAGLGATFGLGSNLGLRIDLEDHISPTHFEFDPALTNTPQKDRTQHDVLWMMGLVVPLGGS